MPLLAILAAAPPSREAAAEIVPAMPIWLEVTAMCMSGFFGAVVAANRRASVTGVLAGGIIVGLGGGIVRDLLLNSVPFAISTWYLIPAVGVASVAGGLGKAFFGRSSLSLVALQALSVGLLVVIGAEKAIHYKVSIWAVIMLGIITASAGGAMLDALSGIRSALLSRERWHLTVLTIGAVIYLILFHTVPVRIAEIATVIAVIILRMLSHTRGWPCPEFPDLQQPPQDS